MKKMLFIRIGVALIVGLLLFLVYVDAIPVLQPRSQELDLFYVDKTIYIHAVVSSQQEFAERLPVTVHAVGSIGRFDNIWNICVCFSGAYSVFNGQVMTNMNNQPYAGTYLNVTHTKPKENVIETFVPGAYLVGFDQTIEWLSPMESVPTIIVYYRNFTLVNGINQQIFASQSYPAKSLHIESYSTIESEKTSLKTNASEVGITALALTEFVLFVIPNNEQAKLKIRRQARTRKTR